MDFQTNVYRHGEWVTETVDINDVLQAKNSTRIRQRVGKRPEYGILTKTVVESPVAHWILPVRLRSAQHMDVAFVGDHYVQIRELGRDGQLQDVLRRTDFGSRIRNAKVIGSPPENRSDVSEDDLSDKAKDNGILDTDGDLTMGGTDSPFHAASTGRPVELPPQQLLIVLECGDCIFLFIRKDASGRYKFETMRHQPHHNRIVHPGFHAAVDPSSRYMALACAEDVFIVYELESSRNLANARARNKPINPIKSFRAHPAAGVIHKMEFLYPHPNDDYHIILLLIIVRHGKSRLVTYEWEAGDDLTAVLSEEKRGQPLPPQHQIPLLIIPLTIHSAFFAISARRIGVCRDGLALPADFDDFVMEVQETSRFHHGLGSPLWTAWTRPYRLPTYNTMRDSVYLAREDGVVMFLDIDSDNILGASVEIGKFDCNIGTSFCSLFDDFNDILIMGGESGPGTVWQIRPRQPNIQLGTIPNWSPMVDFAITDDVPTHKQAAEPNDNEMALWQERRLGTFSKPERIFATSGRGVTGAVTEFRYGLRANIGLDIEFETPVKQSWIFPSRSRDTNLGFHLLASLVDKTMALYLSSDLANASELESDTTLYDLTSRTVEAAQLWGDAVVQVTEKHLVFVNPTRSVRHSYADIFCVDDVTVVDACVKDNLIALSTHVGTAFQIRLLQLDTDGNVAVVKTFDQVGDVTCLCLATISSALSILAGCFEAGNPSLVIYDASENLIEARTININSEEISSLRKSQCENASAFSLLEAPTSIVFLEEEDSIVFGTRGGDVVTLSLDGSRAITAANATKVGLTATTVYVVDDAKLEKAVLAGCDGRLVLLKDLAHGRATFRSINTVWLVDAADSSKASPFVGAISMLHTSLPGHQDKTELVLTGKSSVMLAELHPFPGPVPRSFPVLGTPLKVIYSHMLDCLIIALRDLEGRPTLQFLDPDTGNDLSAPTKQDEPVDYVSGLGNDDDQILGLSEWNYERQGDKWLFLLVSTKAGRLLILSTSPAARGLHGQREKIRYWTRYKKTGLPAGEPIHSVVGWNDNVFFCSGTTIYWEQLNPVDKRLKTQGTFQLGSFASTLRIVNGMIVAATDRDSLEIISIGRNYPGEMTLHHSDSEARRAAHMIEMGCGTTEGSGLSIMLLSDKSYGLAGLWVPWQQPGKDCEVVFETELPASILKLVRGRTRPSWQQARRDTRYGLVPSTTDGAEILGMCIDGSLQHFTLLSMPIWRILRLIQNLAFSSPTLYPFIWETPDPDADEEPEADGRFGMQVDGDMLQRCMDRRALERLFTSPAYTERLFELLDQLDDGRWTTKLGCDNGVEDQDGMEENDPSRRLEEKKSKYFTLLYDILAYYLEPVM